MRLMSLHECLLRLKSANAMFDYELIRINLIEGLCLHEVKFNHNIT